MHVECSHTRFAIDAGVEGSVKWRKWTESEGRPVQVEVLVSMENAVEEVNTMLNDYKCHCLVKDQQSKQFRGSKENIVEGEAVLRRKLCCSNTR